MASSIYKEENPEKLVDTGRAAKNTALLYFRHLLIMAVSLYTVRVVINCLGHSDYGTYTAAAGIVMLCNFLSSVMATASQRFFSWDLGKDGHGHESHRLNITFNVTLQIYLLLIVIFLLLSETIGLWWVINGLNVPLGRENAAMCIYQTAILSFIITLLKTPFEALITAHEEMNLYAKVGILDAFLRLALAFMLLASGHFDRLILYGILLIANNIILALMYVLWCFNKHKEECKIKLNVRDPAMFHKILSFSGWTLVGNASSLIKTQGITLIFNKFLGPTINAAQGSAVQIKSAVNSFAFNFITAVKPQITKGYAAKQNENVFNLLLIACKMAYFLLLIIIAPIFWNMDYLVSLWLKNAPEFTSIFVQLLLLEILFESISYPLVTMKQTEGNVKYYELCIGFLTLLNLPIAWFMLKNNLSPTFVYAAGVLIAIIMSCTRLLFMKNITGFSFVIFAKKVIVPVSLVTLPIAFMSKYLRISNGIFLTVFADIVLKLLITLCLVFFLGLNKSERKKIIEKIYCQLKKI